MNSQDLLVGVLFCLGILCISLSVAGNEFVPPKLPCAYTVRFDGEVYDSQGEPTPVHGFVAIDGKYEMYNITFDISSDDNMVIYIARPDLSNGTPGMTGLCAWMQRSGCTCDDYEEEEAYEYITSPIAPLLQKFEYNSSSHVKYHGLDCTLYERDDGSLLYVGPDGYIIFARSVDKDRVDQNFTYDMEAPVDLFKFGKEIKGCSEGAYDTPKDKYCHSTSSSSFSSSWWWSSSLSSSSSLMPQSSSSSLLSSSSSSSSSLLSSSSSSSSSPLSSSSSSPGKVFIPPELPCAYTVRFDGEVYDSQGEPTPVHGFVAIDGKYEMYNITFDISSDDNMVIYIARPDLSNGTPGMTGLCAWMQRSGCTCDDYEEEEAYEYITSPIAPLLQKFEYTSSSHVKYHGLDCTLYERDDGSLLYVGPDGYIIFARSVDKDRVDQNFTYDMEAPVDLFKFGKEIKGCSEGAYDTPKDKYCHSTSSSSSSSWWWSSSLSSSSSLMPQSSSSSLLSSSSSSSSSPLSSSSSSEQKVFVPPELPCAYKISFDGTELLKNQTTPYVGFVAIDGLYHLLNFSVANPDGSFMYLARPDLSSGAVNMTGLCVYVNEDREECTCIDFDEEEAYATITYLIQILLNNYTYSHSSPVHYMGKDCTLYEGNDGSYIYVDSDSGYIISARTFLAEDHYMDENFTYEMKAPVDLFKMTEDNKGCPRQGVYETPKDKYCHSSSSSWSSSGPSSSSSSVEPKYFVPPALPCAFKIGFESNEFSDDDDPTSMVGFVGIDGLYKVVNVTLSSPEQNESAVFIARPDLANGTADETGVCAWMEEPDIEFCSCQYMNEKEAYYTVALFIEPLLTEFLYDRSSSVHYMGKDCVLYERNNGNYIYVDSDTGYIISSRTINGGYTQDQNFTYEMKAPVDLFRMKAENKQCNLKDVYNTPEDKYCLSSSSSSVPHSSSSSSVEEKEFIPVKLPCLYAVSFDRIDFLTGSKVVYSHGMLAVNGLYAMINASVDEKKFFYVARSDIKNGTSGFSGVCQSEEGQSICDCEYLDEKEIPAHNNKFTGVLIQNFKYYTMKQVMYRGEPCTMYDHNDGNCLYVDIEGFIVFARIKNGDENYDQNFTYVDKAPVDYFKFDKSLNGCSFKDIYNTPADKYCHTLSSSSTSSRPKPVPSKSEESAGSRVFVSTTLLVFVIILLSLGVFTLF